MYGVLYYTHNLVNLAENYWKIKDPENGNGSTKVLFPFGTRSRIIDKRNWTCMNFGWIRIFHPLFALNPTWPCYVVNWGVHPKILSRTIREITTHVGLYVCYVLSTYVLMSVYYGHIRLTCFLWANMSNMCAMPMPCHDVWSVRAWVYSTVWLHLPSNSISLSIID